MKRLNLRKYYKKNDIGVKEYVVLERELILLEKQNNRLLHRISVVERIMLRALFKPQRMKKRIKNY